MKEIVENRNSQFFLYDPVMFIGEDPEIEKLTKGIIEDIDGKTLYVQWMPDGKEPFIKAVQQYYKEVPISDNSSKLYPSIIKLNTDSLNVLEYKGYRATVKFVYSDEDEGDSSYLYGILRDVKNHPKTFMFPISDPRKAKETFKRYIEDWILAGALPDREEK